MDELTTLRRVRSEIAEPTDASIRAGRDALGALIAAEHATAPASHDTAQPVRPMQHTRGPRRHRRARRAGWTAAGTVVALGVATALVLTNVIGLAGWRGGASPAAADVLNSAAAAADHATDPKVLPGQYLELSTTEVLQVGTDTADGGTTSFLTKGVEDVYVPADRSKTWIWARYPTAVYQTFGPESKAAADREFGNSRQTEWVANPGGNFYGSSTGAGTASDLASLPTNPTQLLNYIYRTTLGQGQSRDGEALVWIADRLRTGAVPAAERATMYRAAALIPGITVTEQQANLDGRRGVALGYTEGGDFRQEIIVDPATGAFIGERQVALHAEGGLPAGTPFASTAVTTRVVDSAPHATRAGGFDATGCTPTMMGHGSYTCAGD